MATLTPSDVRWYRTVSGFVDTALVASKLHDACPSIRVGADTDYTLLAVVNTHATKTLSGAAVRIADPSGGVAVAVAVSTAGVVSSTASVSVDDPTSLTYSTPTSSPLSLGTLSPGQAVGVWLRRTATAATAKSPETLTLFLTGTSPLT